MKYKRSFKAVANTQQKMRIYFRDNGRCFYCDLQLNFHNATKDHIIPKSQGGSNDDENLVIACWDCNHERGTMDALEFMRLRRSSKTKTPAG